MHSTSSSFAPPLHACACSSYFPKPITLRPTTTRTRRNNTCQPLIRQTHLPNYSLYPHPATNDYSNQFQPSSSSSLLFHKNHNYGFFIRRPISSIHINNKANRTRRRRSEKKEKNMWWVDLKAALGQRINLEGLVCSVSVISRHRHLALPHVSVHDIRYIDWVALKKQGFQGVVFDKDNTLTVPYSLNLWGPLASSIESCKSVFGNNIAVFSNSAGLHEYDPDGRKARALEFMIGIKVIRHGVKKPAGTGEEVERHFGCESSRLIMVGDRPFTDIVFEIEMAFLPF